MDTKWSKHIKFKFKITIPISMFELFLEYIPKHSIFRVVQVITILYDSHYKIYIHPRHFCVHTDKIDGYMYISIRIVYTMLTKSFYQNAMQLNSCSQCNTK